MHVTETALAVEHFRRRHGRAPKTLIELTPAFLKTVRVDPFNGKPLQFKSDADRVLVYSVGANGVDDGGAPSTDASGKYRLDHDIVFALPTKPTLPMRPKD